MSSVRSNTVLLTFSLGIAAALSGCSKGAPEKEPVVAVQTVVAKKAAIQQMVHTEAVLFPKNQAAITPKVASPVRKFLVNRGSKVRQGQLIAVLENRDLAAAVTENKGALEQAQAAYTTTTGANLPEDMKKAELDVKSAKESLDAQQKLFDSRQMLFNEGALPRKDLDQAAVALVQARAQSQLADQHLAALQAVGNPQGKKSASGQLTSAQGKYQGAAAQLGYTELHSPIDGVVTDRPVYPGETPAQGAPLLTIMDTSSVIAKAHIPQDQAALLKVGDAATLTSAGNDDAHGKVTLVSPATDANSTTVEVWVEVINKDGTLRPGTTVQVDIVAQTIPDALVVPSAAVLKTPEGGATVVRVGKDEVAHVTPVEVGIRNGDDVQITKGLQAGDTVVAAGAYGLPDKTKVKPMEPAAAGESKAAPADKDKD